MEYQTVTVLVRGRPRLDRTTGTYIPLEPDRRVTVHVATDMRAIFTHLATKAVRGKSGKSIALGGYITVKVVSSQAVGK